MAKDKQAKEAKDEPQMRYQCLKCYKTFKDEQHALDCCGSLIQAGVSITTGGASSTGTAADPSVYFLGVRTASMGTIEISVRPITVT